MNTAFVIKMNQVLFFLKLCDPVNRNIFSIRKNPTARLIAC